MKKRMMSILLALSMLVPTTLAVACGGGGGDDIDNSPLDTSKNVTLNLAVKYDANSMITYNQETSGDVKKAYAAANGKTYKDGDIKPVWEELAERLNFTIKDVTYEKYRSTGNNNSQWSAVLADNFEGIDMITTTADNFIEFGTADNRFVDIGEYLNRMPNFKAFLDSNTIVKASIVDANGKMFYAPYFDGYDDLERMFMLRVDWVEKLLNGATEPAFDTTPYTQAATYVPYMPASMTAKEFTIANAAGTATQKVTKAYSKNIITVLNELSTKTGATMAKALRDYIDATYKIGSNAAYTKRSDLFCGVNAAYDPDELVALMRVVKANPELLTGSASTDIVPFYNRNNTPDRVMDLYRLSTIWGVRGLDGRRGFLFVDKDGNLRDARTEQKTMDGLERLNQLYKEGLILESFDAKLTATAGNNGDNSNRGILNAANRGFMTYDYNQTTTVHNNLADKAVADGGIENFNLTPILPPFTNWSYEEGKMAGNATGAVYTRYTESWRSVKPDGWGIFTGIGKEKTERALALIDYMYSPEGNKLMSYGPDEWLNGTIKYNGEDVPKLSATALNELQEYGLGNYTNYYRRFLGGTFPIGYVKQQGMEYQCVTDKGKVGLDNILAAVRLGVVSHASVDNASEQDKTLWSIPTTLPFTKPQQTLIRDSFGTLNAQFNTTSSGDQTVFANYVKYGFSSNGEIKTLSKADLIAQINNTDKWNCQTFVSISQAAFNKSMRAIGAIS